MGDNPARTYLNDIADALPQQLKDAIRADLRDDPDAGFLDEDTNFAKLWEAFSEEDKQKYFSAAGLEQADIDRINQTVSDIAANAASDPKNRFNNEAHAADEDDILQGDLDKDEVALVGTPDPADETEEEAQARRKKYQQAQEEVFKADEEAKANAKKAEGDGKNDPKKAADDATGADADEGYRVGNLGRYGIKDRGDHLSLSAKGKKGPRGQRAFDDKQLRMILLTAILDKKMTSIQFLKNGRIDQQVTSQARTLLATDPFLARVLGEKVNTPILTSLQEEPPCTCKSGISRWMHRRRFKEQEARQRHDIRKAVNEGMKGGHDVRGVDGKTLAQHLKEHERATGQPLKPPSMVDNAIGLVGSAAAGTYGFLRNKFFSKSDPAAAAAEAAATQAGHQGHDAHDHAAHAADHSHAAHGGHAEEETAGAPPAGGASDGRPPGAPPPA